MTAVACNDASPTGPSARLPINMIGGWSGTLNINSGKNICTYAWSIDNQTGGSFAGSYQVGGGTCRQASNVVSGTVSEAGVLSVGPLLPLDNGCTRLAGGTTTGLVYGASLSAAASETIRCIEQTGVFEFTRSYELSLARP